MEESKLKLTGTVFLVVGITIFAFSMIIMSRHFHDSETGLVTTTATLFFLGVTLLAIGLTVFIATTKTDLYGPIYS